MMTAVRKYPKFGDKKNYLMFQQDHAPEMQEIFMMFKCFPNENKKYIEFEFLYQIQLRHQNF